MLSVRYRYDLCDLMILAVVAAVSPLGGGGAGRKLRRFHGLRWRKIFMPCTCYTQREFTTNLFDTGKIKFRGVLQVSSAFLWLPL
jgi:hypothetical protein